MAPRTGEDESSTGIIFETLMEEARERVALDFLAACEGDEAKRAVVLELCQKVLSNKQYFNIISAERSEEEDEETEEGDSENDEQDDDGHKENDESDEESDEGSGDDDGIPTMKAIKDKPYMDGISAETGELPFEEFKDLLDPDENQRENQLKQSSRRKPSLVPNKDAIHLFGEEDAKKLVNWHHHVKHSGQLYSEEWLEGKIRDHNLGEIEKPMLLICLQDNKISKAPTSVLGKICQDLELQSMVKKALEVWGVEDKFARVWARQPTDQYTGDIKLCRQCEIFVARAYVCVSTLKHAEVSDDLGNKLLSCFVDMEKNLPPELAKKRARTTSADSRRKGTPFSASFAEAKVKASNTAENTSTASIGSSGDGEIIEQVCRETGKVLGRFNSTRDIVNKLGDSIRVSHINNVIKGKRKSAYNFLWRYKEVPTGANAKAKVNDKPQTKERSDHDSSDGQDVAPNQRLDKNMSPRKEKAASSTDRAKNKSAAANTSNTDASGDTPNQDIIEQVSLETGQVLREFSNIQEIEDSIGHLLNVTNPRKRINTVLRGVQKSACGFSWRYKNESTTARNKSNPTDKSKETKGGNNEDSSEDEQRDSRAASPDKRLDKNISTQLQRSEKSATSIKASKNTPPSPKPSNQSSYNEADDDRIIEQVHPDTLEVLGEFSSIQDIENSIGHSLTSINPKKYIRRVLKGGQNSFSGFIWRYKGNSKNQILHTTAEDSRKRKALDGVEGSSLSKRTRPSAGEIGKDSHSGIQENHSSSGGLQNLSGTASSRALLVRAIGSMLEINESPYMGEKNAEVGEEMFDRFKDLLIPRGSDGRHPEASQQAKDLFGETLARQMVTASNLIAKSGMLHGSSWKDGLIQGKKCGLISKPMLLLCLQEQRLASSSPSGLQIVISDLGVVTIVEEAIKSWELGKEFPLLKGMKSLSALQSRTKALLGCMIFVARSYRCMIALKRKKISDSVLKKVRKCLSIVHASLEQQVERKKRAREETQAKTIVVGNKSAEPVVQKQKPGSNPHEHTNGANISRVDEGIGSREPFNPGIIMHNLFLKPAKLTPATEPQKTTKPSTPPVPATAGAGRMQEGNGMEQNLAKKQTTAPLAHKVLQTQRTQAQPTNRLLQSGQQTSNRPAQDSRPQAKQQTQKPAPKKIQETKKSQPRVKHTNPATRVSNPNTPTNAPRPLQSINDVPIPPIVSVPAGPWYPQDQAGLLNDAETELAWLTTECSFALRLPPGTISWPFIWEYSSPLLRKELRESRDSELERLVRMHDGFVRDRFKVLKGEIQKELIKGKRRPLMENILPLLRHRSRLANQRKKT
mmetsp:Transcript_31798/g.77007  ORF Transcript_31798/g.77007 Transcript_31798/m.77007 type:complete len:1316 (-) Transcript_31798:3137-7084(-)